MKHNCNKHIVDGELERYYCGKRLGFSIKDCSFVFDGVGGTNAQRNVGIFEHILD
jgi:hypothetical protein